MGQMRLSTQIEAPPEVVFGILADLEGAPERLAAVTKIEVLTEGPVGKGTRWRETRLMFKKEHTEEMAISAFDPPNGYDVTCVSCGCTYDTRMRCTPKEGGTELSMALQWRANSFFAKAMSFVQHLMKGALKKCIAEDLLDIKRAAESAPR